MRKTTVKVTDTNSKQYIEMSLEDYITFIEEEAYTLRLILRPGYEVVDHEKLTGSTKKTQA